MDQNTRTILESVIIKLEKAHIVTADISERFFETKEPSASNYLYEYSKGCTYVDIAIDYICDAIEELEELVEKGEAE